MCDFSLQAVKSRPAQVGDKLITHNFGTGTTGFRSVDDNQLGRNATAVCVPPGTEIGFHANIKAAICGGGICEFDFAVGIFRQIGTDDPQRHHDALELPNGEFKLLTNFESNQTATVLQLPAPPKTEKKAAEQNRLKVVG